MKKKNYWITLAACNKKWLYPKQSIIISTLPFKGCLVGIPPPFQVEPFPVQIQLLIQFPCQSFLLNLSLPFHTRRQLQQVVNTSDQSVQERRIPYKLHDHISHQKPELIIVFLPYEGNRSKLRVCFQFLKGDNLMIATCLVASMKLSCSFAHVFFAVKAAEICSVLLTTSFKIMWACVTPNIFFGCVIHKVQ